MKKKINPFSWAALVLLATAMSGELLAQSPLTNFVPVAGVEIPAGDTAVVSDCDAGIVRDDGSFEEGLGLTVDAVIPVVGRYNFATPMRVVKVCNGFSTDGLFGASQVNYNIVFYTADGDGGNEPGAVKRSIPATSVELPIYPEVAFDAHDVDVALPAGDVFIGVELDGSTVGTYWGMDLDSDEEFQANVGDWITLDSLGIWGTTNTAAIRILVEPIRESNAASNRATFAVNKVFTDGNNEDEVTVSIDCNTGLILDQDKQLGDGDAVEFVVTSFSDGELNCTITEEQETGYDASYQNGGIVSDINCNYIEVFNGDAFDCSITNTPAPVDVVINKEWVIDGPANDFNMGYDLVLYCDSEIIGGIEIGGEMSLEAPAGIVSNCDPFFFVQADQGQSEVSETWCHGYSGYGDDVFVAEVIPNFPKSNCEVIEYPYEDFVEVANGCDSIMVSAGQGDECTITNTVFFEGVPTLSQYGMALLALLMLGVGFVSFRRFA